MTLSFVILNTFIYDTDPYVCHPAPIHCHSVLYLCHSECNEESRAPQRTKGAITQ